MRVIVIIVYVRLHIGDEVFYFQKVTFIEKFDLLYSLI